MAELDSGLVDVIAEELRQFRLRLGENTAGFIADGRRVIELSGGERRDLALQLAELVDKLAERRCTAAAGRGHHVLVMVDPERNGGRVSFSRSMVPIWAPAGPLRAGDPSEAVKDDFELTESELAVVSALVDDFEDLDIGDSYSAPAEVDACRSERVVVDGQPEVVRLRAAEPMSEEARAAFGDLVAAARRHVAATNPHLGVVQELLAAARIARWCIPDGVVHTRFGEHDGAAVKARLQAAVKDVREALTPQKDGGDRG